MNYGYIRVSSKDQNEDRQIIAMKETGIDEKHIYIDKQSGKDFDRPQFQKLYQKLKDGDVLYVKSIDRLGRNYEDIQTWWRRITRFREADIVVLDMPLLDTRRGKDLMGTFLSDIVLQVLSFVAQNERENIKQRQAEGIAAAKSRGVRFGRPPHECPDNFPEVYQCWKNKEISVSEAARLCGFARATFHAKAKKYKEFELLVDKCRNGRISQSEAAIQSGMPLSTFRYRADKLFPESIAVGEQT